MRKKPPAWRPALDVLALHFLWEADTQTSIASKSKAKSEVLLWAMDSQASAINSPQGVWRTSNRVSEDRKGLVSDCGWL
jgi:hypothetical protein